MSGAGAELPEVPSWEVSELLKKIDGGEPVFLLDVRNREDFESWRIEGRKPVDTVNVPYFDFIEDEDAAMASVKDVPEDTRVVVLCATGDSSEMIADMLIEAGTPARNIEGGMQAYGEYLQPVKVPTGDARFEIWQLNRRGKGCLTHVIRAKDEAIVVDASRSLDQIEQFLDDLGVKLVHVLDTHVHADHVSGGPELAEQHGVPYFVTAGEGFELQKKVTELEDGAEIALGGDGGVKVEVQAIATPGHTPGSTSYLVDGRFLLSGDTIFVTSVGRPDLGGHVVEWGKSLYHTLKERVAKLPDDTVVLPAHYADVSEIGPDGVVSGRMGDLRASVPELQIETEDEFVEAMKKAVTEPPSQYADIIQLNLGAKSADPEKITEWELGKNQCAAKAARQGAA